MEEEKYEVINVQGILRTPVCAAVREQEKLDGKYQWKVLLGNIRTSSDYIYSHYRN